MGLEDGIEKTGEAGECEKKKKKQTCSTENPIQARPGENADLREDMYHMHA